MVGEGDMYTRQPHATDTHGREERRSNTPTSCCQCVPTSSHPQSNQKNQMIARILCPPPPPSVPHIHKVHDQHRQPLPLTTRNLPAPAPPSPDPLTRGDNHPSHVPPQVAWWHPLSPWPLDLAPIGGPQPPLAPRRLQPATRHDASSPRPMIPRRLGDHGHGGPWCPKGCDHWHGGSLRPPAFDPAPMGNHTPPPPGHHANCNHRDASPPWPPITCLLGDHRLMQAPYRQQSPARRILCPGGP